MAETRYINKPGGVLVHLDDGTVEHVKYGDPLPDNVSAGQAKVADRFTSTSSPKPESEVRAEVAARAQEKAALAEAGQVGSSSSPVPGNFSELDEQGASRFIASLKDHPQDQAAVVVHERLNANRQEVVDAAGDEAKNIADELIAQLGNEQSVPSGGDGGSAPAPVDVTALEERIEELAGEVETLKENAITGEVPTVDPEDFTKDELRKIAEDAGVEDVKSGDTKAEIADKINAHNAAKAAESTPTPAPSPEG